LLLDIRLLSDIRDVFAESALASTQLDGRKFITTTSLVMSLNGIEDAPWGEFGYTARKLAFHLRQNKIKPGRNPAGKLRGYYESDFADAFRRYLRPEPSNRQKRGLTSTGVSDTSLTPDGSKCQTYASDASQVSDVREVSEDNSGSQHTSDGLTVQPENTTGNWQAKASTNGQTASSKPAKATGKQTANRLRVHNRVIRMLTRAGADGMGEAKLWDSFRAAADIDVLDDVLRAAEAGGVIVRVRQPDNSVIWALIEYADALVAKFHR
jgi:hypothetical protein